MTTKYGLLLGNDREIKLDDFQKMISVNAYYRAEKRNFEPGHEMDDWHEAELVIIQQYGKTQKTN